jgi:hypothetical protein
VKQGMRFWVGVVLTIGLLQAAPKPAVSLVLDASVGSAGRIAREKVRAALLPGVAIATSSDFGIDIDANFETAAPSEVARRFHTEVFVTQVEVPVG